MICQIKLMNKMIFHKDGTSIFKLKLIMNALVNWCVTDFSLKITQSNDKNKNDLILF